MLSLSEFLTTSLNEQNGNNLLPSLLREQIKKALEAYKQHLINDNPKTIEWKNIEKQLVIALERMEAPNIKVYEKDFEMYICDDCSYSFNEFVIKGKCPVCGSNNILYKR